MHNVLFLEGCGIKERKREAGRQNISRMVPNQSGLASTHTQRGPQRKLTHFRWGSLALFLLWGQYVCIHVHVRHMYENCGFFFLNHINPSRQVGNPV